MTSPAGWRAAARRDRSPESRPTYSATQLSLTRLAGGLTAAGLLWLAAWTVLAPPEDVPGPWREYGLVASGLAVLAAGSALWPHLPGSRWTPLVSTSVALVSLTTISNTTALMGWWPTMELAALLALAATVALPTLAAAGAQLAIIGLSFAVMMRTASPFAVAVGPAAAVSSMVQLLVAAVALLVGNAVLRRASNATDLLVAHESHERELLETEARRRRTERDTRRFLHDSGMNSLESVSRGIPAGSVDDLRHRCAVDAQRWLRITTGPEDDTEAAFRAALAEADMRGLRVDPQFTIDGRLPDDVLQSLAEATAEALRNSAKHAGVDTAGLDVRVRQGTATITVTDHGCGFDADRQHSRLGLTESIDGRLRDIGGRATVASTPGQGTTVTLQWPVAGPRSGGQAGAATGVPNSTDPERAHDLLEIFGRLAWLPIAAVAIGAVASTAANWWSVHLPWLLGATGLLLAGACGWVVHRWRTAALDTFDLAVLTLAMVIATLAAPVADPFCSAASGPPLIPDGRVVTLAVVGVLLASWRVSLTMLGATLAALAVASVMWLSLWPICAPETIPTAIGLGLVATAGVGFGAAVRRQQSSATRAFEAMEATNLALARSRADELVRAEWEIAAVADVRDLLRTIAAPTTELDDPQLRTSAGDAAARLRAAVRASGLPGPLAIVLSRLVDLGRGYGFGVSIEGDLSGAVAEVEGIRAGPDGHADGTVDPLAQVAEVLDGWLARHCPAATAAVVTVSDFDGRGSVVVRLDSAAVTQPSADATEPADGTADTPGSAGSITYDSWTDGPDAWWQAEWMIATT